MSSPGPGSPIFFFYSVYNYNTAYSLNRNYNKIMDFIFVEKNHICYLHIRDGTPIRSVHQQNKLTMWFKKCTSDTSWHFYSDASFLTHFHR